MLALVNQVMRYLDSLVRMEHSVLMLMDLTEQCAYLHVSLAAVLKHLKFQSWLFRIIKIVS